MPSNDVATDRVSAIIDAILCKSPVAIAVSRSSDGRIVSVSEPWVRLTGYSRTEVIGKTPLEAGMWARAEDRDLVRLTAEQVRDGRTPEMPYKTLDGRQIVIRVEGTQIEIVGESYDVVYVTDVTAERQNQAEMLASKEALQKLNDDLLAQVELFRLTESVAKVGHWIADESGQHLTWSKGLFELTRLPVQALVTREQARSMIHPEDLPKFVQARVTMDGSTTSYRAIMADGALLHMRTRMGRHARSDGVTLDYGVIQDFSDEHEAKTALQERLDQLQLLTSRLPEMVFQLTMLSSTQGLFNFVSEAVNAIFGITAEQACANSELLFRRVVPEDRQALMASIYDNATLRTTWAHEFRICGTDEVVRHVFGKAIVKPESSGALVAYGSITDITGHKESQSTLRESEERFRALTELSSDWYWEQDENFRFVRFDGHLVRKAGKAGLDSIGKTRWEVGALNMSQSDWAAHKALLESHATFRDLELHELDYKGRPYWMSLNGAPIFDEKGKFTGYRGNGRNITERKTAEAKIEHLAFFDALTNLPNRRLLQDRLQHALATLGRDHVSGALLFIDLDNFKDLNDAHGHDMGDLLLQQVAQRLIYCVREVDTVARLGGDEFVVLLHGLEVDRDRATAQVETAGKKILDSLNQTYLLGMLQYHCTPSIGVVLFEDHHQTVEELLKHADLAMYESKGAGRNTMRFFDPAMQQLVAMRTSLKQELRLGLERDELLLHYQPVMNAKNQMVGVEALVRWSHPHRGMVRPMEFIPVAEQTGLIVALGNWVLETACQQLVTWGNNHETANLTMAVNVSVRQFRHPTFVEDLCKLLSQTGANPHRLKLELTESLLLTDPSDAVQKMTDLGAMGVKFSLDDFGTGYSSMSYLKVLPLEQLKIDQSFVRDVLSDSNDAAIARTILALGHTLGLQVVAEGVETAGQRDFLLDNGCALFQGYFFGRPVPVEQLDLAKLSR